MKFVAPPPPPPLSFAEEPRQLYLRLPPPSRAPRSLRAVLLGERAGGRIWVTGELGSGIWRFVFCRGISYLVRDTYVAVKKSWEVKVSFGFVFLT